MIYYFRLYFDLASARYYGSQQISTTLCVEIEKRRHRNSAQKDQNSAKKSYTKSEELEGGDSKPQWEQVTPSKRQSKFLYMLRISVGMLCYLIIAM